MGGIRYIVASPCEKTCASLREIFPGETALTSTQLRHEAQTLRALQYFQRGLIDEPTYKTRGVVESQEDTESIIITSWSGDVMSSVVMMRNFTSLDIHKEQSKIFKMSANTNQSATLEALISVFALESLTSVGSITEVTSWMKNHRFKDPQIGFDVFLLSYEISRMLRWYSGCALMNARASRIALRNLGFKLAGCPEEGIHCGWDLPMVPIGFDSRRFLGTHERAIRIMARSLSICDYSPI